MTLKHSLETIRRTPARGFTLVELLVATAVLAVLAVILTQVVGHTSTAVRQSKRIVDTAAQAQLAFEVIGRDLSGMILRPDVPVDFEIGPQNGSFVRFFTEQQAPLDVVAPPITLASSREVSLVGYRLTDQDGLQRGAVPILWERSIFTAGGIDDLELEYVLEGQPGDTAPVYDTLAPGVIEVAIRYLDSQGQVRADWPGPAEAQAVAVTLAILDRESLRLLDQGPGQLAGAFNSGVENPRQSWTQIANWQDSGRALEQLALPRPALTSVRIYERVFPLPRRSQALMTIAAE